MQVQSSLRWFVDNFSTIADWRATLLRVAGFRRAVIETDVMHNVENRISYSTGPAGEFDVNDLQICSSSGTTMLQEKKVQIKRGERVLIVGESGTGKTLLFRALAGLWPWGSGTVTHPEGEEILYMPRTPYLPPGTLMEVLAYPKPTSEFQSKACGEALARVGLQRLTAKLDSTERWERELNEDEQQALELARVIIHKAPWVLIDEVLDSLDDTALERVADIFSKDLAQSGVIYIGRNDAHHLFSRVLHLIMDPTAKKLKSLAQKPAQAKAAPAPASTTSPKP
jgi:vitamin B12/bleomycin/antimicrobial peptide transport system ATP-binding/permease protein